MQGDQSAQPSTDTENKHLSPQIIHGVDEYPDINDTLSSIEIGDEEDEIAYAEQQEALRLELEILNEQYKEKGGLKGMKNPLENLSPENDNKDSLIVNVSEDWNILPTFKSSLAEVFDNVGMLHVILFFTLHFNALLFTLLVSDINQFTFSLSVLLVNIISILYLSIRSLNDFTVPNMLTLFKRVFRRGMQAIARFILQYTGESEPIIKQLSKYDQTENLAVEDRIF
jgi:hypothetical protein